MSAPADYIDYNQQEEHQQVTSTWKDRFGQFVQDKNDKFQAFTQMKKARTRLRKAHRDLKNDIKAEPGKSFSDLLKESTGIDLFETGNKESELYLKIALSDSRFRSVPLLVTEIPEQHRDDIRKDPHGFVIKLTGDVRKRYDLASTVEDLVAAIEANAQYADTMNGAQFATTQKDIYGGETFRKDLERERCDLQIFDRNTGRTTTIVIGNNAELCGDKVLMKSRSFAESSKKEQLESILDQIKLQSRANGLNLTNEEAFSILKQFVLAYRGQNAKGELASFELNIVISLGWFMKTSSEIDTMFFEKNGQSVKLVSKSENTGSGEIMIVGRNEEKIADSYSFGFIYPEFSKSPNKKEILSTLKIKSTVLRDSLGNVVGWDCPFRENPPTHFILYGGGSSN